jgi:hypothetical protein
VTYLVGHHLAHLAADTGADVVGCTSVLPGASGVTAWPEDDVAGMRMFLDEAVQVLPQVHAALEHDRPDVVLYDIGGMAAPVAAERWGVPAVQLSPSIGYLAYRGVRRLAGRLRVVVRRRDGRARPLPGAHSPCDATEFRSGRRPVSVRWLVPRPGPRGSRGMARAGR